MPPTAPTNRISVSTAGMVQQKLLEYQAALTGRSISSLASSLLEEIIDQKVHAGQWHPTAIRLVEELIKEREAYLAFGHAELRAGIRAEIEAGDDFNDWEPVAEALHPNTDAVGYFTDREWKKEPAPKADPLEQEMVDYGMRYGLSREESEDIYEWYADEPRANIRQQMRQRAGHEERLPEGESIERKDKDEEIPF